MLTPIKSGNKQWDINTNDAECIEQTYFQASHNSRSWTPLSYTYILAVVGHTCLLAIVEIWDGSFPAGAAEGFDTSFTFTDTALVSTTETYGLQSCQTKLAR